MKALHSDACGLSQHAALRHSLGETEGELRLHGILLDIASQYHEQGVVESSDTRAKRKDIDCPAP